MAGGVAPNASRGKNSLAVGGGGAINETPSEVAAPQPPTENDDEDDEDDDEDFELYFTDPQQLLDIFLELEEQNLSLIQNSQDTEEALEEMKQTINRARIKMEKETEMLKRQIDSLNEDIRREEEREAELKIKASYFNYGEFKSEEQDKMLKELNKKVSYLKKKNGSKKRLWINYDNF